MSCTVRKILWRSSFLIALWHISISFSFPFAFRKGRAISRWKLQASHTMTGTKSDPHISRIDALICGGGPAGLLSAICLAQKFPDYQINLYEKTSESPMEYRGQSNFGSKNYLIGLGGRGITALEAFGVWEDVKNASVMVPGRMDWTPGSSEPMERMLNERKYSAHVLSRDLLVSMLHRHIVDNYSDRIDLHYGCEVLPVDFNFDNRVLVEISMIGSPERPRKVSSNLVIASDGTARTFAKQIELDDANTRSVDPFHVVRYRDENERVYKIINFQLPSHGWRKDLNYSVRSRGNRIVFDALPSNDQGAYCGNILFRKEDEMAQSNVDPEKFRAFLDENLPQFSPMFDKDAIRQLAKTPPSQLPMFRYVTPRLHHGNHCVLLGDCAHTVKPFFGMGANSALEDVKIFGECIEMTDNLSEAVSTFSKRRSPEIKKLVQVSQSLDKPGIKGVFSFLIPVILDGIFHKLAPQIFGPNIISMLQREDMTFIEAIDQKDRERKMQYFFLGSLLLSVILWIE